MENKTVTVIVAMLLTCVFATSAVSAITIAVDMTGTGDVKATVSTFVKTNNSYARYEYNVNAVNGEQYGIQQSLSVNKAIDVSTETTYTRAPYNGIGDIHLISNTGSGIFQTVKEDECRECAAGTDIDAQVLTLLETSKASPVIMSHKTQAQGHGNYITTGFTGKSRENGTTRARYGIARGTFNVNADYLCERPVVPETPKGSLKSRICPWKDSNGDIVQDWRVFRPVSENVTSN